MFISLQLFSHFIGDYLLQSHWMAENKTKRWFPALAHALMYSVPFIILVRPSLAAYAVIVGTHYAIDRWRLARYVAFAKNFLAPPSEWKPWGECSTTGYHKDVPPWLAVWLLIITDHVMHVCINALALAYL